MRIVAVGRDGGRARNCNDVSPGTHRYDERCEPAPGMIPGHGGRYGKEKRERSAHEGRSLVKATCPRTRATLPAIAPTIIAATGPEPLW